MRTPCRGLRAFSGVAAVALIAISTSGCVSQSRTDGDYAKKAANTVEVASSSVHTLALSIDVLRARKTFDPYLGRVIGQAESDASSAIASFDVVQPPSHRADALRAQTDAVMGKAINVLTDARTAIRRSDHDAVLALASRVRAVAKELDAFDPESA